MTNPNLTLVGVLVDRSGSMAGIASQMSTAINEFMDKQRSEPGDCEATLAQFDTVYQVVYDLRPISQVSAYSLHARGGTALNDAIGTFVVGIGETLAQRPEAQRPGKVVIVIVTDGYENASKEWSTTQIKDLIDQQRSTYSWEFMFLGKDIDAFAVAESIGIGRAHTIQFTNTANTMAATSNLVASYRAAGVGTAMGGYVQTDRDDALNP